MKTLYQRQDSNIRKVIRKDYINSANNNKNKRLKRLKISGISGLILGLCFLIYDLIEKTRWFNLVIDISLIMASIYYIYQSITISQEIYNKYLTANKNKYQLKKD